MNFDFSPEQKEFAQQAARLLAKVASLAECRRALLGDISFSKPAWTGLEQIGFQALLADQAHGGHGMTPVDLCLVCREIGYSLAPIPSLSSVYFASQAIDRLGSEAQRGEWLPSLIGGKTIGSFALSNGKGGGTALRVDGDGLLHASGLIVPDAAEADFFLICAEASEETQVYLVRLNQQGVHVEDGRSCDPSRPVGIVSLDGAKAEQLETSSKGDWLAIIERAAVYLSFEQIGAAQRALEMARDYALQRNSFGRPIGTYQAIKHKLADAYAAIQLATSHAYYGAWALSSQAEAVPLAAAGARVSASRALRYAAQENIQVHGGIGYTWESDCQLFYRRARYWNLVLGDTVEWQKRIFEQLRSGAGKRYAP